MLKAKDREKILQAAKRKTTLIYKGRPIRLTDDFPQEKMEARKKWDDMLKRLKEQKCQQRNLY